MAVLKNKLTKYVKGAKANKLLKKSNRENKPSQKIKVGSFCTGMGAMPISLKESGIEFDFEYSCEIDKFCHQTISTNFPELKKQYGDIFDIDPILLPYVDVMEAGFPCQVWSIAGKRAGFNDEDRGTIIYKIVEILLSLIENNKAPKVVLLENVKNIISHDHQSGRYDSKYNEEYKGKKQIGTSLHIIEERLFSLLDKYFDITWSIENTLEYGLPQNRERWFCVMTLKESNFTFDFKDMKKVELTTSLKDYLDDEKDVPLNHYCQGASLVPNSQNKYKNRGKIEVLGDLEGYSYGQSKRLQGINKSARCLTTGECCKYLVDEEHFLVRTLTINEKLNLHGFPYWVKWNDKTSKTQKHKQLGNTISVIVLVEIFKVVFKNRDIQEEQKVYTIKKSIINKPDMKYLNITSEKYKEYMNFVANGGKLFLEIEKYENKFDKSNKVNSRKITIEINDLIPKGWRNKKQEVRRYKIISNTQINKKSVNNINYKNIDKTLINPRNNVLYPWLGSNRRFTPQLHTAIDAMNIQNTEYFIDSFGGSINFTINNIEKVNAKYYVLNDIDPILVATYKAIKQNYKKVSKLYLKISNEFLESIPKQYIARKIKKENQSYCKEAKLFYKRTVNSLNYLTDIYDIAATFIWMMQYTSSAIFAYDKNNKVQNSSYNWYFKVVDKLNHIKYYSQVLNKYDVIIENLDVFELIKKYSHHNTFIYLAPPYLNAKEIYNSDNSNPFQIKLLEETNHYRYRLYSNEDCKKLYDLGIDEYFNYSYVFERNTNLGATNKKGKEYLAFSINEMNQTNTLKAA